MCILIISDLIQSDSTIITYIFFFWYLIQFLVCFISVLFAKLISTKYINELKLFGISLWSLNLLYWSIHVASLGGLYIDFYFFTIPYIIYSFSCFSISLYAILLKRFEVGKVVSILHSFSIVFFLLAIYHWPGGDDGSGMAWMIYVGFGSILAIPNGIAAFSTIKINE